MERKEPVRRSIQSRPAALSSGAEATTRVISPAEAAEQLREEWKRAKAGPATTPEQLAEIEELGRAVSVVVDILGGTQSSLAARLPDVLATHDVSELDKRLQT